MDLTIDRQSIDIRRATRHGDCHQWHGAGTARAFARGQDAVIRVTNQLAQESTSIHWHGLILPFRMDGVPGVSFAGIGAGETFTYRFPVRQNGTYWYHSHTAGQEQLGVYGPLIIDPAEGEPFRYDREYVVMLGDWLSGDPMAMVAKLKKQSSYSNYQRRTVGDFIGDARKDGLRAALADRWAWGKMRMDPTDIADITGHHFTFLMNGLAPDSNWTGLFRPGERVRLRFINAAAVTFFDVRIPGLRMSVVAADGQNVKPVTVDEFRIGIAETYDVIVEPKDDRAYTIFAETIDRSGFARGTLAPRPGMGRSCRAAKRPVRTMADIGLQRDRPGNFDVEPAIYISDRGEVSAELTVSADLYLTQRLVLQPRFQGEVSLQGDDRFGTGEGVNETDIGLRLRYEIRREIAPYIGVSWLRSYGETARLARQQGESSDSVALVIGLQLWW